MMNNVSRKPEVFVGVQALRFVAALLVVLTHSTFYVSERLIPGYQVWHEGATGVNIFFVISGFVMMSTSAPYARTPLGWVAFAQRRLIRIVPLYWIALLTKTALSLLAPGDVLHNPFNPMSTVLSMLFVPFLSPGGRIEPILGVGWTLNFEMFFYLFFAFAIALRRDPLLIVVPFMVLLAIGSVFRASDWPVPLRFYFDPVVLDFVSGVLIARYQPQIVGRHFGICLACMVLGFLVLLSDLGVQPPLASLQSLAGATLVVGAVIGLEPRLKRVTPPLLAFLGSASYSLYLFHPIVAPAVPAFLAAAKVRSAPVAILLCIALAVGVASVVYTLLEKPLTCRLSAALGKPGRRQHRPDVPEVRVTGVQ